MMYYLICAWIGAMDSVVHIQTNLVVLQGVLSCLGFEWHVHWWACVLFSILEFDTVAQMWPQNNYDTCCVFTMLSQGCIAWEAVFTLGGFILIFSESEYGLFPQGGLRSAVYELWRSNPSGDKAIRSTSRMLHGGAWGVGLVWILINFIDKALFYTRFSVAHSGIYIYKTANKAGGYITMVEMFHIHSTT